MTLERNSKVGIAGEAPQGLRRDIQSLRGIAILVVLLYHAGIGPFDQGFLGVDVFFVISGFLITNLLTRGVQDGSFGYLSFYIRRARRLLPAAYVVFFITAIASYFVLGPLELHDFWKQLLGALTFTGNISLWLQSGYFEGEAEMKPLLHVWSLAIEEQYYMLLPLGLVLISPRYWRHMVWLTVAGSIVLCLALSHYRPGAAFYLLPSRLWELGVGSLVALHHAQLLRVELLRSLAGGAVLCLALIAVFPTIGPHPGLSALLATLLTAVAIVGRAGVLESGPTSRVLAGLGDISYSLYLVHWPLFALANNAYLGNTPVSIRVGLVIASVVLATVLYRYVELPFWKGRRISERQLVGGLAAASAAMIAVATAGSISSPVSNGTAGLRVPNRGLSDDCGVTLGLKFESSCQSSIRPRVLVWGDSFAMHLVPALLSLPEPSVVQATRSQCGPLDGFAPLTQDVGGKGCGEFNRTVLEALRRADHVEIVVLASPFSQYFSTESQQRLGFSDRDVSSALHRLVTELRSQSKRIVMVAPPPSSSFDIGLCLERKASGALILGVAAAGCQVREMDFRLRYGEVLAFLDESEDMLSVGVVRPDDYLCRDGMCRTQVDGVWLYRDRGHLSIAGSKWMGESTPMARDILERAR